MSHSHMLCEQFDTGGSWVSRSLEPSFILKPPQTRIPTHKVFFSPTHRDFDLILHHTVSQTKKSQTFTYCNILVYSDRGKVLNVGETVEEEVKWALKPGYHIFENAFLIAAHTF